MVSNVEPIHCGIVLINEKKENMNSFLQSIEIAISNLAMKPCILVVSFQAYFEICKKKTKVELCSLYSNENVNLLKKLRCFFSSQNVSSKPSCF